MSDVKAMMKEYILRAEKKVLGKIIDGANDGLVYNGSQWVAWKSGENGINPCNYGALSPYVDMCVRHKFGAGKEWVGTKHIPDFVACFWAAMRSTDNPPGEGCYIKDGNLVNCDSDPRRHCTMAGVIDACMHPEMQEHIATSTMNDVKEMAKRWGQWIIEGRWYKRLRETHRMFNALQDLVALYQFTRDETWLAHAHALFFYGWGIHMARTVLNDAGDMYFIWDSGYPWEKRGFMSGDLHSFSWYDGEAMDAMQRFWPYANLPAKQGIRSFVMRTMQWYLNRTTCPQMVKPGGRSNTPMHGLLMKTEEDQSPYVRPNDLRLLTPGKFHALASDDHFCPPLNLEWHNSDGDYFSSEFTRDDGTHWPRQHHQGVGTHLTKGDGFAIPTMYCSHKLLHKKDSVEWKLSEEYELMTTYCYLAFADYWDDVCFEKQNEDWWSGAVGKSRGLAWRLKCNWRGRKAYHV